MRGLGVSSGESRRPNKSNMEAGKEPLVGSYPFRENIPSWETEAGWSLVPRKHGDQEK